MGLVLNSSAIIASTLTTLALYLGFDPLWSFAIGAVLLYIPVKMALPFGRSKKPISQTAIITAFLTVVAFSNFGYGIAYAWMIGLLSGYFYLYWWLFLFPKIFAGNKTSLKTKIKR